MWSVGSAQSWGMEGCIVFSLVKPGSTRGNRLQPRRCLCLILVLLCNLIWKNNCLMSHSHLMQYWILTFLYLLYSQVFGNTKEGNFLNMNCNCDSLWAYDWGETGGKGESNGGRSIISEASKPSWSCTTCCTCTCCTSSTSSSSTQTWRTDTENGTTQQATRSSPGVVWCPHVVFCTISV